ncbi:MAG: LytTR family DNA-binding domain-containing protein [Oscillospiraceae bacterium]|nr:LytTR family DNA-binding domain-containing protein [Oscillospiraceae bacterium]
MLHIFICEDNDVHRTKLESVISKHLLLNDFDMSLALSANNPTTLLDNIKTHTGRNGLYFLDVDLQCDINGIELAVEIKKLDVSATIVFVTTLSEMSHLVFKYKVEAMDYIPKDIPANEAERRIAECMQVAYQRFLDGKHSSIKYFTIKIGDQVLNTPYRDILYFESSVNQRHKLLLHTTDSILEFRGHINDVARLGSPFIMCHQSYVVNLDKIRQVDKVNRLIEISNGDTITISRRRIAEILQSMNVVI